MKSLSKVKLGLGITAFGAAVLSYPTFPYWTHDNVTVSVTDKDRITQGSGQDIHSKYIVFTKDANGSEETFENTDSWRYFKFSSSDLQGRLEVGKTFNCSAYGWRIPLLSQYRNLTSCTLAEPAAKIG